MSRYALTKQLSSYRVPRKLLEELEDYLQTLSKFVNPTPEGKKNSPIRLRN